MLSTTDPRPVFLLIDGHAVIYRAFYGFPNLTAPSGQVVNAVYGFSKILLNAIENFDPKYLAVTFDHPKPTFRHKQFKDYKANRSAMPDDLQPQIPIIKDVVKALNIPQFELEGYEADDLIGTISYQLDQNVENGEDDVLTLIVTGDQDAFQLVDNNTHVWLPGRGRFQKDKEYDSAAVEEKYGVIPDQVVDLKALMGDSSDNIPGVKGVGPKTAIKLIKEFGDLETVYKYLDKNFNENGEIIANEKPSSKKPQIHPVLKGAILKKMIVDKENAFLSKKLATITKEAPIKIQLEDCIVESYDKQTIIDLFKEFDFNSLINLLPMDKFEASVQEALF